MMTFQRSALRRQRWTQTWRRVSFWTYWDGSMLELVPRANLLKRASMFWGVPWTWSTLFEVRLCWRISRGDLKEYLHSWRKSNLRARWLSTNHRSCMGFFVIPVASFPADICNRCVWKCCSWEGPQLINCVVAWQIFVLMPRVAWKLANLVSSEQMERWDPFLFLLMLRGSLRLEAWER